MLIVSLKTFMLCRMKQKVWVELDGWMDALLATYHIVCRMGHFHEGLLVSYREHTLSFILYRVYIPAKFYLFRM